MSQGEWRQHGNPPPKLSRVHRPKLDATLFARIIGELKTHHQSLPFQLVRACRTDAWSLLPVGGRHSPFVLVLPTSVRTSFPAMGKTNVSH